MCDETDTRTVVATGLVDRVAAVLGRHGVQEAHARIAEVLVAADLQGIDSDGVARLPAYLRRLEAGATVTRGEPRVDRSGGATASVDGANLMGPAAAEFAMAEAATAAVRPGPCSRTASPQRPERTRRPNDT